MIDYSQEFRRRILELRKERNVSQEELAQYVGVNKSTISKYERGIIEPTLNIAKLIAQFFGVTVESLVNPEYDEKANIINKDNASEIIGLDKGYIKALKIAESNNLTPNELIDLIEFSKKFRK